MKYETNELLFSAVGSLAVRFTAPCTERIPDRPYHSHKSKRQLDGEHRIIDGYHSAYILARFKDGLYNGDYEEYIYNKLKAKGSYKEGWKDGIFRKYDDEGRVTEEKSYKSGKLDGAHRTFYTNGKLEMERFYKAGKQDHCFASAGAWSD